MAQPASSGDLAKVIISRDTDLDGTLDSISNLPVPVSGICANGIVSCDAGTWNQCRFFRWEVDQENALKLTSAAMPELAGCYCINNSCGSNLAWGNMPAVLRDLGGGMIGALTTADPRYGVVEAVIDGPVIRYVGAQSTACAADPLLPQTRYRARPALIASDAYTASTASRVFQQLKRSAVGTGTSLQYRHCQIERRITVLKPDADAIISRTSGGYQTIRNGTSFDFLMGSPADNSLPGGACTLIDFKMTLHVSDAERITAARLSHFFADDWAQIRVDGQLVASGPSPWTGLGIPPGKCELKSTFHEYPNLDLKPFLTIGDHEIWLRVAVAKGGEGFAQVHVDVDDRPVSINHSHWDCSLEPGRGRYLAVRLGFRQVRGLANIHGAAIVSARGPSPFESVEEVWRRAGVPRAAIERLAEADAFSCLAEDRRQGLWKVKGLGDAPLPLFAAADEREARFSPEGLEPDVTLRAMSEGREVVEDYRSLQMSLRGHPLQFLRAELDAMRIVRCADLGLIRDGRNIEVAGVILVRQRPGSAKGVLFVTIEDETGIANGILWPNKFEIYRRQIMSASMIAMRGRLQKEGEIIHVICDRIIDHDDMLRSIAHTDFAVAPGRGDGANNGGGPDPRDPSWPRGRTLGSPPFGTAPAETDLVPIRSHDFH